MEPSLWSRASRTPISPSGHGGVGDGWIRAGQKATMRNRHRPRSLTVPANPLLESDRRHSLTMQAGSSIDGPPCSGAERHRRPCGRGSVICHLPVAASCSPYGLCSHGTPTASAAQCSCLPNGGCGSATTSTTTATTTAARSCRPIG